MPSEILKHTADLRIRVWADSLERLFQDAVFGMMGVLKENFKPQALNHKKSTNPELKREIKIKAGDQTALIVDFLNEALTMAQTNKEVYTGVKFNKISETELEAELNGIPVDEFDEDIKAVTYHEADVRQNESGEWETMLVFDI